MSRIPKVSAVIAAIREGHFFAELQNRLCQTKYVPDTSPNIVKVLKASSTDNSWQTLSPTAKQTRVDFLPFFRERNIQRILYIGANAGDAAMAMDEAFPGMTFYLVEPVPDTFVRLVENVRARPNMHCICCAAGAKEGVADMHVDFRSTASSLLPYTTTAIEEFAEFGVGHSSRDIQIPVKTADRIVAENCQEPPDMLVVDVEGYEDMVFRGATKALDHAQAVLCELNVHPGHVNASSFDSVYMFLKDKGFVLRDLLHPVHGAKTLQIMLIDGIFVRP